MTQIIVKTIAILFLFTSIQAYSQNNAVQNTESQQSSFRIQAYRNFGPAFYSPNREYPSLVPTFGYPHLTEFAIPLKKSAKSNKDADETNWVPVPVKGKAVYYRAEYHFKDIDGVDVAQWFDETLQYYKSNPKHGKWDVSAGDRADTIARAKIQIVVFPTEQFQFKYYPGWTLVMKEGGRMWNGDLKAPRGGVKWHEGLFKVSAADQANLVGVFKGTYDNQDTIREGKYPGLVVDGVTVDSSLGYVETMAIYRDGTFHIGPYSNLNAAEIQWLRQNELPIMVGGELNEWGAYPAAWNRFCDDILRSYLFMSRDGKYVGYAWTNYSHPSFTAKVLQKMGFTELMQLDIHPAIGAAMMRPSNDMNTAPFFKGGAYAFVPEDSEVYGSLSYMVIRFGEAIRGNPIQWPYNWANMGSSSDFFGVFLK